MTKNEGENALIPRKFWYVIAILVGMIGLISPFISDWGFILTIMAIIWYAILYLNIKARNKLGIKK